MVDPAALISELDALANAADNASWDKIAKAARVLIAQATLGGGVVSYTINGRQVTKSIAELREILKLAEGRGQSQGGGIVVQLGEFG
jgi:hypothetical protein